MSINELQFQRHTQSLIWTVYAIFISVSNYFVKNTNYISLHTWQTVCFLSLSATNKLADYFHASETLTVVHLLKISPASYATWRFITMFIKCSTSTYSKPNESTPHDSFFKLHFNSILSPTSLPFMFPTVLTCHLSHASYRPRPSHLPWADNPNTISCIVRIMNLLITHYVQHVRYKYSPQQPLPKHLPSIPFHMHEKVRDPHTTTHKTIENQNCKLQTSLIINFNKLPTCFSYDIQALPNLHNFRHTQLLKRMRKWKRKHFWNCAELFLAGMKVQWDKDSRRILLGDITDGKAVMLQPMTFKCAGVWLQLYIHTESTIWTLSSYLCLNLKNYCITQGVSIPTLFLNFKHSK